MAAAAQTEDAVSRYLDAVLKIAFTYTKNTADAEDLAQEVFLALLCRGKGFDSEEHRKAWLIRVTINKCKNFLKQRWITRRALLPDDLGYLPKEQRDVLSAVLSLEEKYRVPIHLFYYEGYSIKEIAAITRVGPATVGTRLKRGRERLRALLEEEEAL